MLALSARAEDVLERLYMRDVEHDPAPFPLADDSARDELVRRGLLRADATPLTLTKEGRRAAELAVRRHRLAERLMQDVLQIPGTQVDSAACEFEHSLHHGVDERVCILLGHPKTCPHGRPIPPGKCCRERKGGADAVIAPLSTLKGGEHGIIAYLSSRQTETVQKLMALGVLPGSPVAIIQTFPSIVFQVGQTQIAVDNSLAADIYVRRAE
ncbi:MAG TPA: metal-dependent transcriptional regulator [Armatimonadota bacterium]|jgi:DtxR family Mn-dependent transcriptional regulator